MKMTSIKKILSGFLCIVLIAAVALFTFGCKADNDTSSGNSETTASKTQAEALGNGGTKFTLTVTGVDGKQTDYQISTDKKTVGDALLELNLIAGENGPYGLYIKTVNGITLDFDKDGKYWAFYENGKYATKGISETEITAGATYSLKAE
ncbi:MAG: DUF4430 domain-containing protein [Clostridia bacterium]|nr:DUF4430 domain-containing protein [Clostridia bacterium]